MLGRQTQGHQGRERTRDRVPQPAGELEAVPVGSGLHHAPSSGGQDHATGLAHALRTLDAESVRVGVQPLDAERVHEVDPCVRGSRQQGVEHRAGAIGDGEELAGGLLNLINWPMMLLSGVWFSLEGAGPFVQNAAKVFPLTHVLDSARAVMLDGATLADVGPSLAALTLMSGIFLVIGAMIFRWEQY